jgi:hypothetical protein
MICANARILFLKPTPKTNINRSVLGNLKSELCGLLAKPEFSALQGSPQRSGERHPRCTIPWF